ncbi:hypothetical protein PDE_06535 [Penicillium oxalicum 114-2]|uniref:Ubiquitin-conjugating enzyme E2 Z n=1 Tax=Penicillium oxalicum (strain 114-2 / CGMCC 5302) TaxID=933388 RepID=S7ZLQ3_PENO1|nr:hypothetical protein PDE_06535 [Penicillium oxalicum 114-2]
MANQCVIRLMRELRQLEEDDDIGRQNEIYDVNIRDVEALIIGPPGTPYAMGFYQFQIKFPPGKVVTRDLTADLAQGLAMDPELIPLDYPEKPPLVALRTTNSGTTRFGPNLYACGKVCLSILGTWISGPNEQWNPVQGLATVLRSIQSLLDEKPVKLEPGFENHSRVEESEAYNAKIHHENLRVTVIQPLEASFRDTEGQPTQEPSRDPNGETKQYQQASPFLDMLKRRFLWYLESYKMAIDKGLKDHRSPKGGRFTLMSFEYGSNAMKGRWDYEDLKMRIERLETQIMDEIHSWPRRGLEAERQGACIAVRLRAQFEKLVPELTERTEGMVCLELVDNNPFLWRLIYHGRPMTQYDGGVLKAKIYISPNHPAEQPRVFLETPLYHVRVSPQNALIYLPLETENIGQHIDGIISSLEEERPPVNPLMTVNPAASALCWGSPQEQRQYRRNLRRSVEATLE